MWSNSAEQGILWRMTFIREFVRSSVVGPAWRRLWDRFIVIWPAPSAHVMAKSEEKGVELLVHRE